MKRFLTLAFSLVLFLLLSNFSNILAADFVCELDPSNGKYCFTPSAGGVPTSDCFDSLSECNKSLGIIAGECDPSADDFNYTKCYMLNKNHTVGDVYDTPGTIIGTIVNNLMIVGGLVLFGMIIYAGFLMIKGGYKGFEEARGVLIKALLGLIVMFVAYWLVMIVSYLTGIKIPGIN